MTYYKYSTVAENELQGIDSSGNGLRYIAIFDEQRIFDINSFEEPRIHPQRIDLVCVDEKIVVHDGFIRV